MNPQLHNATSLARALGVSVWWVRSAKRAGAWTGRFTTIDEFQSWRKDNPGFVAARVWGKGDCLPNTQSSATPKHGH